MIIDRTRRHFIYILVALLVITACGGLIAFSFIMQQRVADEIAGSTTPPADNPNPGNPSIDVPEPDLPGVGEITEAKFTNLQPVVDQWLRQFSGSASIGVMIYDLNNSRTAASYKADEVFNVASVYKLLFAYDGYRQISLGVDQADQHFITTADKGSLTLSQCLDLIIRESYNGCADPLAQNPTRISRVNNLIREVEMTNTSNIGLQTTAADLTKLLRYYWRHTDLNSDTWTQLADSMLNQPIVDGNNWRQGLPSGFSSAVKVYNKVGWEWNGADRWNIYADAAILDFTDLKHYYTMVVITNNAISDSSKISQLGRMIEDEVILQSEGIIK